VNVSELTVAAKEVTRKGPE
jgi:hypothetical protein